METTHPNLVGMDGRFDAKDEWNNDNDTGVAYPNIEIVGFPKAGTSHLYSILLDRPDTVEFHPSNKEFCSGTMHQGKSNETIQQALFEWHENVYRENLGRIQTYAASVQHNNDKGNGDGSSSVSKKTAVSQRLHRCRGRDSTTAKHMGFQ